MKRSPILLRVALSTVALLTWLSDVYPAKGQHLDHSTMPAHLIRQSDAAKAIDTLMTTLHRRGQFNGAILVAIGGKAVYRKGFGDANVERHQPFTPETTSYIASVAKTFTAMIVMILAEQHKVGFDDPISKYIPELGKSAEGVTIRHLLTHTSGLPDVGDLGIDHPGLTSGELLRTLSSLTPSPFHPGVKYRYSNAGYVLLSIIIERVSGRPFIDVLRQDIFKPLGMHHTDEYVTVRATASVKAAGYDQFGKPDDLDASATGASGDGGLWSTLDDLLKWDQALYSERLVRQSTLSEAFTPGRVQEGKSTYGFGWNIATDGGETSVWHTGSAAGYRAFIGRRLNEKVTVVMLTNRGNSKRPEINEAIVHLLHGEPYVLPKLSIAELMYATIERRGIDAGIQQYQSLKTDQAATYDFDEPELNTLGYQLLYGNNKPADAVRVFELNTLAYPASSNAFDSLGEAYAKNGSRELAIKSYQKAVTLDPANLHAADQLKELTGHTSIVGPFAATLMIAAAVLVRQRMLRRARIRQL